MANLLAHFKRWRPDDRIACLLAYSLLLLWCLPLLLSTKAYGLIDWDWFIGYFHTVRLTLLSHGEFPGLNPFMYLGSPLWGNPQIGPISQFTPFVLLFGPIIGLKLGIFATYLLSFEAARSLGKELFDHPLSAVIAGLLYALNTSLAAHWMMGHFCFGAYFLTPWLLLWCLRLHSHRNAGLYAGLLAGLMVQIGLHYYVVYSLLFGGLLAFYVGARASAWSQLLRFGGWFGLGFLTLAASRLLPILQVLSDFPRQISLPIHLEPGVLWRMFLLPQVGPSPIWLKIPFNDVYLRLTANEFYAYAGLLVLSMAFYSLRRGLRFYHIGALLSFWLMLGASEYWHLSFWLAKIGPFKSLWVIFRWRTVFLACLAFSAARGIDLLLRSNWAKGSLTREKLILALPWLLPLELVLFLFVPWTTHITPNTYHPLSRKQLRLPKTRHMLSVRQVRSKDGRIFFPAFMQNVGIQRGYEPLFGYKPAKSLRMYPGHPRYKGEYVLLQTPLKSVTPARWSPNRLLFRALPPGKQLLINLTPGRGWSLNGTPLFVKWRVFELEKYFIVRVPKDGVVDLRYRPPGLETGLWLTLLGLLMMFLWWRWEVKGAPRPDAPGQ